MDRRMSNALLHKDKLHFSSRWYETSKGKQHFSIPLLCLFHLISIVYLPSHHVWFGKFWPKGLFFFRSCGWYLPIKIPTLQGTLLRIFEDKTAEGNAGLDGLHLPALGTSWWKLVQCWYPSVSCLVGCFQKIEVPQNGWFHNGKPY